LSKCQRRPALDQSCFDAGWQELGRPPDLSMSSLAASRLRLRPDSFKLDKKASMG
jgi:hypothetical protein